MHVEEAVDVMPGAWIPVVYYNCHMHVRSGSFAVRSGSHVVGRQSLAGFKALAKWCIVGCGVRTLLTAGALC